MNILGFTLDHIGWSTTNIEKFEKFWCGVLRFKLAGTSTLDEVRAKTLFGVEGTAEIRRYNHPDNQMVVEIHNFGKNQINVSNSFARSGISHICISVEDRDAFLLQIPYEFPVKRVRHPGGWDNIFIQDGEGNWIEVRTSKLPGGKHG